MLQQVIMGSNVIVLQACPKPAIPSPAHLFSLNPSPGIYFHTAALDKLWFIDLGTELEIQSLGLEGTILDIFVVPSCIPYSKDSICIE